MAAAIRRGAGYVRGLSEITFTPLVLPSLDKGSYVANMYNFETRLAKVFTA